MPELPLFGGNKGRSRGSIAWEDHTVASIRKTGTWQTFPAVRKFCGTN
jgi:hypothetical protein